MGKYYDMLMEDVRMHEGMKACMNCGVCTAVCPAAEFYNYDPRQIVSTVQTQDDEAIEALREAGFDVMKAENMELLTVRGYTDELWRRYARGPQVFVRQATQSTVRVVRKRE